MYVCIHSFMHSFATPFASASASARDRGASAEAERCLLVRNAFGKVSGNALRQPFSAPGLRRLHAEAPALSPCILA